MREINQMHCRKYVLQAQHNCKYFIECTVQEVLNSIVKFILMYVTTQRWIVLKNLWVNKAYIKFCLIIKFVVKII